MADWYPGAYRVLVGGNGGSITARPPENIFHIAASDWNIDLSDPFNGSKGIAGWTASTRSCNTYTDQYGAMQQYCSLFEAVNGTKDGNWRNRTHESWNPEGLNGTEAQYNSSKWTPEQCERFSDFLAWDCRNNGVLLQNMKTSQRNAHGCGVHRYGIDPWRVNGGESWTIHSGKVCPGTARVNQLDGIIARAIELCNANVAPLPVGRVDLKFALARAGGAPVDKDWFDMATADELRTIVREEVFGKGIVGEITGQTESFERMTQATNGQVYRLTEIVNALVPAIVEQVKNAIVSHLITSEIDGQSYTLERFIQANNTGIFTLLNGSTPKD